MNAYNKKSGNKKCLNNLPQATIVFKYMDKKMHPLNNRFHLDIIIIT